jgi:hypothetical protein
MHLEQLISLLHLKPQYNRWYYTQGYATADPRLI